MNLGTILKNDNFKSDYYEITFFHPEIAKKAKAGQFVHVLIDNTSSKILRRPFSIHDTDAEKGTVTVAYKVVGDGTRRLATKKVGEVCDLLDSLGKAYTDISDDIYPVIVDGGYGAAATYLLVKHAKNKGTCLFGARGESDLILTEKYEALGCDVRIATNDGSVGKKGFVTELIDEVLEEHKGKKFKFYSCGPHPMLMALAKILQEKNIDGEISLDHVMCCGVGACFACVVKTKSDDEQGWKYSRACKDGPIFDANEIYTGE